MRRLWAGCLSLPLGMLLSAAHAGEAPSPAAPRPALLAASAGSRPASSPAVSLGRPVPLAAAGAAAEPRASLGGPVVAVSYEAPVIGPPRVLARAQNGDEVPQRMPPGNVPTGSSTVQGFPPPPDLAAPNAAASSRIHPVPGAPVASQGTSLCCGTTCCSTTCCEGGTCCPDACAPGCDCGCLCPPRSFYASAEYLLWKMKESSVPSLVTTSMPASSGILGRPDTFTVFGGEKLTNDARSGARFTVGYWIDPCQALGVEGSFFYLGQRSVNFAGGSPGLPIVARPFFDLNMGMENSELVAFPGMLAGTINVNATSRLWGGEINARTNVGCGPCWRLDLLAGYRYLELDESLGIREMLTVLPGAGALGGSGILVTDRFETRNFFNGGQVGADVQYRWRDWTVDVTGKLALGCTHEIVDVGGATTFAVPGSAPIFREGGLLALPTNIGRHSRNEFAAVPELGVKVGYSITPWLKATVGYNALYWSEVVRPGDQIDRVINRTQIPSILAPGMLVGAPRPGFIFHGTDFWTQGITLGLEFTF